MLEKLSYPPSLEYSSDGKFLPIEFYLETIPHCKQIDLMLGYFSSNAIRALAYGFAQFIFNGGTLRIVTNHFLSEADKAILFEEPKVGYSDQEVKKLLSDDLEGLAKILENGDQHFFDCLKYLQKHNRLNIQPVKTATGGMSHYKQGLLTDADGYRVSFNGSCNFTYAGLIENGESFSVARSWGESSERYKIEEYIERFESTIKKENESFQYLDADDIVAVIKEKGQDKDLEQLIEDEIDILNRLNSRARFKNAYSKHIEEFEKKVYEHRTKPRFPYDEGPRDYQQQAYVNWKANNYQGIFAMATGTGKTITSLNCLLEEFKISLTYRSVIIVPTFSLVEQWEKEVLKFNFCSNIIKVCSKTNWRPELSYLVNSSKYNKRLSFIIITTYASFHRNKFQDYFKSLPSNTLFIADEAHNLGSPKVLEVLKKVSLKKRIGLSATPKRYFDEQGDRKIEAFFNDKAPYVYSITMEEAIKKEWLCPYEYHPHIVFLNENELEQYAEISRILVRYFDSDTGKYKDDPIVNALLMKRKRIIHKAVNKKEVFKGVIEAEYKARGSLKYSLIYAPEGLEPNYEETDVNDDSEDDLKVIDEYTKIVSSIDERITIRQFTSGTINRESILKDFSDGNTDTLVSMKCLDEGVDVPKTKMAIFCSSTGNPRQFIQRRGRVLRTYKGKDRAIIHDLIVVPRYTNETDGTFSMERNIVKMELDRVVNFAFLALNKYESFEILKDVCEHYGINLFEVKNENI